MPRLQPCRNGRHRRLSLEALGGVADQVNHRVCDAATKAKYHFCQKGVQRSGRAALLTMRTRVKAAMAQYKDVRRKLSDKARERLLLYERAYERQVRAEAAALDVVVRLPPKW